jgi:serpin B
MTKRLAAEGGDGNYTASPVNIFMALGMLAEITGGQTRSQILELLGTGSLEETCALAQALWQAEYADDGVVKSILASSLWINEKFEVKDAAVAALAEHYYATAWSGDPKDKGFSRAFKTWLDEQTGGLLKDAVEALDDFDEDMIMTLAATIYFKAPWADEFVKNATRDDTFRAPAGDVTAAFMHSSRKGSVLFGDGFKATFLRFANGGGMWIILPDEGTSPGELFASGAAADFLIDTSKAQASDGIVELSLPKFDVDATTDLKTVLQDLGIRDAFDPDAADFSPLTDVDAVVSAATHSARVKIDEEGIEAAAFTVMTVGATAALEEPPVIEFNADRPFIFAVTGVSGAPLFIGTVSDPS